MIDSRCKSIYNQYSLLTDSRDELQSYLNDQNIGNNIYYPIPLHLQECFAYLNYHQGDFPVAEKVAKQVLAIPVFSELTLTQQEYVVEKINQFFN